MAFDPLQLFGIETNLSHFICLDHLLVQHKVRLLEGLQWTLLKAGRLDAITIPRVFF
jgi:hypothetical protein